MFSDPTVIRIESRVSSTETRHSVSFRFEPDNDLVYSVEGLDPNHGYSISLNTSSYLTVSAYLPNGQLLGTDEIVNITGVTRFYIITRSLMNWSYNLNRTIYEYSLLQSVSFDVSSMTVDGTDSVKFDISIYPEVVTHLDIYAYSENNRIVESDGDREQRAIEIIGQHAGSTRIKIEVRDRWMRDYEGGRSYVFYVDVNVTKPSVFSDNDGDGSKDNPYLIATPDDLQNVFKYGLVYHFKQVADIDLQNYSWDFHYTRGAFVWARDKAAFKGTYDGNNYAIRNLKIDENERYVSLFGGADAQNAFLVDEENPDPELEVVIKNVRLLDYEIRGSNYAAPLVGETYEVKIVNCHARGKVMPTDKSTFNSLYYSSGLVGYMYGGEIIDCSTDVEIIIDFSSSSWEFGGLIGSAWEYYTKPVVKKSFSKGYIKAQGAIGGIAGGANATTFIDCYSEVNIEGYEYLGGFIGESYDDNVFKNCYSVGEVVGQSSTGGFIGAVDGDAFTSVYYDSETSGQSDTGKGEPRTTEQMKKQSTFVDWDFENVWHIVEGVTYPTFEKIVAVQCVAIPLDELI